MFDNNEEPPSFDERLTPSLHTDHPTHRQHAFSIDEENTRDRSVSPYNKPSFSPPSSSILNKNRNSSKTPATAAAVAASISTPNRCPDFL